MLGTKNAESAAPAGQPVDQRTGQPMMIGSIPTATQVTADREAQREDSRRLRAEVFALLEQHFAPSGTVIDQRRLNSLVQAELDRLAALPDGIAGAIAQLRETAAASARVSKAREKDHAKELETTAVEAKKLLAEVESRSAWVHDNILASRANEARLQELIDELTAIEGQHHIGIDLGGFLRLPGACAALAGQKLQIHGLAAAANHLPSLEQCPQLPEEFQRPKVVASNPAVDQRGKSFDPNLPKDYALRMTSGSVPAPRNADGSPAGASVRHALGDDINRGIFPRTEAQSRAARRNVEAEVAKEDGA